jgi:protein O-GlcNAc transferase
MSGLAKPLPDVDAEAQRLRRQGAELARRGHPEAGLTSIQQALSLAARDPVTWCERGNVLQELGRLTEALVSYGEALTLRPGYVAALLNRSNALRTLGRQAEALTDLNAVLAMQPNLPEGLNNRGNVLRELKRFDAALADFEAALVLRPDFVFALTNRGKLLLDMTRVTEALADFERALQLTPDSGEALFGHASARLRLGRELDLAVEEFAAAARCGIELVETLEGQAAAYAVLERHPQAAACVEALLRLAPDRNYALGGLLYFRLRSAEWTNFEPLAAELRARISRGVRAANPHGLQAITDSSELQLTCARAVAAVEFPLRPVPEERAAYGSARASGRIRVAYLSGDFGEHPVAHLLAGVIERHDREGFESLAVALRPTGGGPMERRLRTAFNDWLEVSELQDAEVAARLRALKVDIAIDLSGYTEGMRLGVFAHRAAPVQVSYLGYAGTTGAAYMDYLIADSVVIPRGSENGYIEHIVRLPHCYLPYDNRNAAARVPDRAQAGLPPRGFVFCGFTSVHKINPALFSVWMRLLHALPDSVLWLRAMPEAACTNLRAEAERRGIDPARLVFAPRMAATAEHLARHGLADLFLDTFPYNAHSTACDALWVGVPVLTLAGKGFASRVAASALTTLNIPELITHSMAEYESQALRIACDTGLLKQLRERLSAQRQHSPLFDTERYTRHLERAYRIMRDRAACGAAVAAFDVMADQ